MGQLRLFVSRSAYTALQTVSLIGVEVAYRADFQPTFLCLTPYFKIVTDSAGEALVASTQTQNAIGEFQFLKQALNVSQHFAMALLAMLRSIDAYDLNFAELMEAVETTYVLTITASFAAETLGVCTILDWQILLVDDDIAVDVGHRNFSCGYQVEVIHFTVIHLAFFVRQLTSSVSTGCIHYRWRHDFLVTSSSSLVKEKVDQSTLQAGTLSAIDRETSSCDFHAQIEIN